MVLVEPTAPWEERTVELKKYQPLILESQQNGWKAWNLSVEVGCSGFAGLSIWKALGLLGINGLARKRLVVSITNQSGAASRWIWIQREVRWQGQQVTFSRVVFSRGRSRTLDLSSSTCEAKLALINETQKKEGTHLKTCWCHLTHCM